jgi:hypothetical protein
MMVTALPRHGRGAGNSQYFFVFHDVPLQFSGARHPAQKISLPDSAIAPRNMRIVITLSH